MAHSTPLKILPYTAMPADRVTSPGVSEATIRVLIGPNDGASHFTMRLFELAPGGCTAKHSHPHEHEIFFLEGSGVAVDGPLERPVGVGMAVFVPPDRLHQFRNTGSQTLRFLCLIPNEGQPGVSSPPSGASCPCAG